MTAVILLAVLGALPARAETEGACREAYQPSYETGWRLKRSDWDAACVRRTPSRDILREAQRAFMDACQKRFAPREGLTVFDIQIQCARGTAGEARLGPAPGEALPPPVAPSRLGANWKSRLKSALEAAEADRPDSCFAGLFACFNCDRQVRDGETWTFLFHSADERTRRQHAVKFDEKGRLSPRAFGSPPRRCIAPRVGAAEAVTTALRNGIDEKAGMAVELSLLPITDDRGEVHWDTRVWETFPALRERTVWHVFAQGVHLLVDAETGKVAGRY